MKDPRGKHAKVDDGDKEYPCVRCYATINAAFDDVCNYLADESRVPGMFIAILLYCCIGIMFYRTISCSFTYDFFLNIYQLSLKHFCFHLISTLHHHLYISIIDIIIIHDESKIIEYNDLVISHRDLEDITPYSKICWSQCPQILFIKSRDFCTYCHHRWRNKQLMLKKNTKLMTLSNFQLMVENSYTVSTMCSFYGT